MEQRFARHKRIGHACKAAIAALGLGQVPLSAEHAANTMTAPRYPQGVSGADFLAQVKQAGVILAGGLHPQIKSEYFRIGHMGPVNQGDLLATIGAIEAGLSASGYAFESGVGVTAAMNTCSRKGLRLSLIVAVDFKQSRLMSDLLCFLLCYGCDD